MTATKTQPIIAWPGGKRRMLAHLLPLIPEHHCYVEVFGGAAAVLLAKPRQPGKLEVYNDVNSELVNLFRMAKHHPEELCRQLDFMPASREEFYAMKALPAVTEIQRAARFLRMAVMSFGGDGATFGTGKLGGGGAHSSLESRKDAIRAFALRFDRVVIEQKDWRELLSIYDAPTTFFYIDPPYLNAPCHRYDGFSEHDVQALADRLAEIKARWVVSLNDHPVNRKIFARWNVLAFTRANGISNIEGHKKTARYGELVIHN